MYDGYRIGGVDLYNPWSILNYADTGFLDNYWVNTSSNFLIRGALQKAGKNFWNSFDVLASGDETRVWLTLDTSYAERDSDYSLWGVVGECWIFDCYGTSGCELSNCEDS